MRLKLIVLVSSCILSSCIGTKYLKKGETILYKQEIKGDESLDTETLNAFFTQNPNSRVFVLPFTPFVYLYQIGHNHFDSAELVKKQVDLEKKYDLKIETASREKKKAKYESKKLKKIEKISDKITNGNQFMKWGEPLAVYSKSQAIETKSKLQDYLFSKGFFDSRVVLDAKTKGNDRQIVRYQITQGSPYIMDSVLIVIEDQKIASLVYNEYPKSPLQGRVYDQDLISAERDKIFELLANNGYFNFKKQYIGFEVDSTTLEDHRLIVKQSISNPYPEKAHKVYKIDSVIFVAGGEGSRKGNQRNVKTYQSITYDFTQGKYPQRILDWRIFLYPDSMYSKKSTIETQKQLSYLDIFKFVNINYDTTGGKFIANIFTSPLKKYQTSSELGLSYIDNGSGSGLPGPFFNFNAKNRNVFQSLEILNFDLNASIQGIPPVSGQETSKIQKQYSRFQYGGRSSVVFPQFIFPMSRAARGRLGKYNPRTKISLGVNFENRLGEYNRTTLNTSYAYLFQANANSQFTFKPLDFSFILSNIISSTFADGLEKLREQGNISYVSAFRSAFVGSSALNWDYNSGEYGIGNNDAFLIRGSLEYGGLGRSTLIPKSIRGNLAYFKYLKTNLDYRVNLRINSNSSFAYRANLGIAYLYGRNKSLPYEKYFFSGGSNSIRAWSPRRLGPGAFGTYKTDTTGVPEIGVIDYKREQPGDILFETNLEFRSNLISIIDYALFVDAGNVWLWNSRTLTVADDPQGDNGKFMFNQAFNELAVGTGVGLRIDFSFLVLRLDGAIKVLNPAFARGQRFVLDDITKGTLNKTTFNIGIGYPF